MAKVMEDGLAVDVETAEILEAEDMGEATSVAVRRRPALDLERRHQVGGLLRPVAQPSELLAAQEEVRRLIAETLLEDRDYGKIPGTSKPTLYKPGAERIAAAFGCHARFRVLEREADHERPVKFTKRTWEWHPTIRGKKVWSEERGESQGLYRYVLHCELIHRESGVVIGEGVGACSTMESRYIDRPRDCENVALKMAKKRAFVDAVLTTCGLSEQFTQDVEDLDLPGTDEAPPPFSLDDQIPIGKHKGKSWRQVLDEEAGYVKWAVSSMDKLTDQARDALRKALEEQTAAQEGPKPDLDALQNTWLDLRENHGISGEHADRYSRVHPQMPDDGETGWGVEHVALAIAEVRKHGWETIWQRVLAAEEQAKENGRSGQSRISKEKRDEAVSTVKRAREFGLIDDDKAKEIEALVEAGNEDALTERLTALQGEVFKRMSQTEETAEIPF